MVPNGDSSQLTVALRVADVKVPLSYATVAWATGVSGGQDSVPPVPVEAWQTMLLCTGGFHCFVEPKADEQETDSEEAPDGRW